jgi:hypothetical protein
MTYYNNGQDIYEFSVSSMEVRLHAFSNSAQNGSGSTARHALITNLMDRVAIFRVIMAPDRTVLDSDVHVPADAVTTPAFFCNLND